MWLSAFLLITSTVSQAVSCALATKNPVRRVERQPGSSKLQGTCRDEGALLGPNSGEGSENEVLPNRAADRNACGHFV